MTYLRPSSLDYAAELRGDKLNDNVAHALLALEAQGHDAGWDHPVNAASIFTLNAHPTELRIRAGWSPHLTELYRTYMDHHPHETGACLLNIAYNLHQGAASGALEFTEPPWPLHGYGIRAEVYTGIHDHGDGEQHKCNGEHPEAQEARFITFVDVNGCAWWLVRVRDEEPELGAGPRTEEASFSFAHALDGLIAAVLQRPFPER